jgi:hypothetical protein
VVGVKTSPSTASGRKSRNCMGSRETTIVQCAYSGI